MQPTQQYHGSPNWTQWWLLVTLSFHVLSPQHHIAPPPIKVLWIILGMHVTESVQALRINSSLLNYPRRGFVAPKRLLLKNTSIFYGNVLIRACPKCLEVNRALFWFVLKIYGSFMATEPKSSDQPQQKECISNPGNTPIPSPPKKWPTRLNMAFGSHKFPWGFCVPWPAMSNIGRRCIHSGDSSTVSCITLYASWRFIN